MTLRVAAFGFLAFLSACGRTGDSRNNADPSAEVRAVADGYLAAVVALSPFQAIYAGLQAEIDVDPAVMDRNAPTDIARFRAAEDRYLERLAAIDPAGLSSTADRVMHATLLEALEASRDMRVCQQHLWNVNHLTGWQASFLQIAETQPVATPVDRARALARWRRLPAFLAQEEENLKAGLAAGYSAPRRVVVLVIAQLDAMLAAEPTDIALLSFAAKAEGDESFTQAISALAEKEIAPAIAGYRDFLKKDYLPKARPDLAIKSNRDGEACYEALLRGFHTASFGAKATYERGLAAVKANREAAIARGAPLTGETELAAILARVNAAPANRFSSEQELIDWTRALIPVTRVKSAAMFEALPAQEMIVEPYPPVLKGSGQPSRYEPRPPAEGPAVYRIDTEKWATQTRGEAEIVAIHEGWPGHHLQIATAQSVKGLHPIVKLLGSTAYIEGWARYAEGLAEEAGLYESGYGAVTRRAWPARGMAVDPGLHVFGWSEQQARAFLIESGRFDEKSVGAMIDRIAAMPGQLTAYDTGGLEFAALREEAVRRLGPRFDIASFHAQVLENGPVPLAVMRAHVEAWIAAEETKSVR
jgi:uncharacterized protein (DUF885 family)